MTGSVSSFEGTEKKVELVVDSSIPSFRSLGDGFWTEAARRAGAGVLSKISNDHCDAYLLSESSQFVFDHKLVMMTCGRTTLHESVIAVLDVVAPEQVRMLLYERKNETFPHDQPTSFFEDARILHERLPGRAYQFGRGDEHHLHLFHVDQGFAGNPRDTAVEVLMRGLDEEACRGFDARAATALERILPGFDFDDHWFDPTGYSLNAIREDEYFAIHVTPEPAGSYASFETNHRFDGDLNEVVGRLLQVFRPRSYDVVRFDRSVAPCAASPGYHLKSHVTQKLEGDYRARFMSFFRPEDRVARAVELPLRWGAARRAVEA